MGEANLPNAVELLGIYGRVSKIKIFRELVNYETT